MNSHVCKHFKGVLFGGNQICKSGINVRELVGGDKFGWLRRIPCSTKHETEITCDKFCLKSKEEIEADDLMWQAKLNEITLIGSLVVRLKKENPSGGSGQTECPKCKGTLHYSVSSYNLHVHGKCETENCLQWMQ